MSLTKLRTVFGKPVFSLLDVDIFIWLKNQE